MKSSHKEQDAGLALPADARLPINRCNLPAAILGSLTFQRHPATLRIDGVAELHKELFARLERLPDPDERARHFMDYMSVHFRLEHPEDAGLTPHTRHARPKANYLRALRGWMFDTESREAAVLKGWVESRFGLLTRYHRALLTNSGSAADVNYLQERATGVYNTNALEAQLDLVYAYAQLELKRVNPDRQWLTLYRGTNTLDAHDWLRRDATGGVVLLNNLNSFSNDPERADEFGDMVLATRVPLAKIFCYAGLLPGVLGAEYEYLVLGGLYQVRFF